ncbi:hypothetical protein SVIOM342S_08163 [Streptomyces violaceorubidus]
MGAEGVADVAAGAVVAHAAGEAQAEAGGPARHDRGGAAEREGTVRDELFALSEGERGVEGPYDGDLRIGVADDEQVEAVRHGSSLE